MSFAVLRLQVRVPVNQSRHRGEIRRVDDLPSGVMAWRVRLDALYPIPFDDDIDIGFGGGTFHVHELPCVDDDAVLRDVLNVFQVDRHRPALTGNDVDNP
jgi:hypothetical protein